MPATRSAPSRGIVQLARDPASYDAAVVMTRWMFPYILFVSLVALSAGILNTWKRFAAPAATPVLLNLCMIGAAWQGAPAFAGWGIEPIYAMAAGVMAGGVLQLAVQVPVLRRVGYLPRIGLTWGRLREAWRHPGTRHIGTMMAPALLGVGVAQISLLINTQIASWLPSGSVTWLGYADRLMEFPTAMLGVALGVVLMPQLASAHAKGDTQRYSAMLDWGLRLVVLLAVPSSVALLVFAQPLVSTLFHYGAFTDRDVRVKVPVGVAYGTDLDLAEQLMQRAAHESHRVLDEPAPVVWLAGFGENAVNFEILMWIDDPEAGIGNIRSDVLKRVWHLFREHGIALPYPQRDIHVKEWPQAFQPAPSAPPAPADRDS